MIELAMDLPDWLWAMVAAYFGASALLTGLETYLKWRELRDD